MTLQEQLAADLKTAMLSKDSVTVSVLRLLQSELKNQAIALGRPLDEAAVVQVIQKEVKKRKETAETYRTANQPDRATAEEQEAEILSKYLPAAADPAQVEQFIQEAASKLQPLQPQHRGELIRQTMQQFPGQVDGKTVADLVGKLF